MTIMIHFMFKISEMCLRDVERVSTFGTRLYKLKRFMIFVRKIITMHSKIPKKSSYIMFAKEFRQLSFP